MKLIHMSDLHLGKKVNEFNMIEDQRFALNGVLDYIDERNVDGLIFAGDVFDKAIPSVEAVNLWDWFLKELNSKGIKVFVISGNHDSADRLGFASDILENSNVYISKAYDGSLKSVDLGPVCIYMMPYVKPINVKKYFPDEDILDYNSAVVKVLEGVELDSSKFNILVSHQYVSGGERCESEELSIGGLDAINAEVFDAFDYVALGHLHGPQRIKRDCVRYSGSLLKYSFSEERHNKSVTLIEIDQEKLAGASSPEEKAEAFSYELLPIASMRDMRVIKGSYDFVMDRNNYINTNLEDYVKIVLTDEEPIYDCLSKLRTVYPNIMAMEYENIRTMENRQVDVDFDAESITPIELIGKFFENQNNKPMDEAQTKYCIDLIEEIWG